MNITRILPVTSKAKPAPPTIQSSAHPAALRFGKQTYSYPQTVNLSAYFPATVRNQVHTYVIQNVKNPPYLVIDLDQRVKSTRFQRAVARYGDWIPFHRAVLQPSARQWKKTISQLETEVAPKLERQFGAQGIQVRSQHPERLVPFVKAGYRLEPASSTAFQERQDRTELLLQIAKFQAEKKELPSHIQQHALKLRVDPNQSLSEQLAMHHTPHYTYQAVLFKPVGE